MTYYLECKVFKEGLEMFLACYYLREVILESYHILVSGKLEQIKV